MKIIFLRPNDSKTVFSYIAIALVIMILLGLDSEIKIIVVKSSMAVAILVLMYLKVRMTFAEDITLSIEEESTIILPFHPGSRIEVPKSQYQLFKISEKRLYFKDEILPVKNKDLKRIKELLNIV